jgi:putative flippase GtrA
MTNNYKKILLKCRWFRFLLGGVVNTAVTYGLYLSIELIVNYQIAYFFAYLTGMIIAYIVNSLFVFRVELSYKSLFAYPLVYLAQYLISAMLLGTMVEVFGLAKVYAPLLVIVMMIPLTYVVNILLLEHFRRIR